MNLRVQSSLIAGVGVAVAFAVAVYFYTNSGDACKDNPSSKE